MANEDQARQEQQQGPRKRIGNRSNTGSQADIGPPAMATEDSWDRPFGDSVRFAAAMSPATPPIPVRPGRVSYGTLSSNWR